VAVDFKEATMALNDSDIHTMVGIQPKHLRLMKYHLEAYRDVLRGLEKHPVVRKKLRVNEGFELLEVERMLLVLDQMGF
jgi:hypothetical protein